MWDFPVGPGGGDSAAATHRRPAFELSLLGRFASVQLLQFENGGPLSAVPRRLDIWATSAPPGNPPESDRAAVNHGQAPPTCNPPESDRAAADRDQAPLTTLVHRNAGKRRRERDQDVDRPTRKQMQRKLRARQDQPMDSTL